MRVVHKSGRRTGTMLYVHPSSGTGLLLIDGARKPVRVDTIDYVRVDDPEVAA